MIGKAEKVSHWTHRIGHLVVIAFILSGCGNASLRAVTEGSRAKNDPSSSPQAATDSSAGGTTPAPEPDAGIPSKSPAIVEAPVKLRVDEVSLATSGIGMDEGQYVVMVSWSAPPESLSLGLALQAVTPVYRLYESLSEIADEASLTMPGVTLRLETEARAATLKFSSLHTPRFITIIATLPDSGRAVFYPKIRVEEVALFPDTTPPVPGVFLAPVMGYAGYNDARAQISWTGASDDRAEPGELEYLVCADYYAPSDLSSCDAVAYGGWIKSTEYFWSGQGDGSSLQVSVIVRDPAGNRALYPVLPLSFPQDFDGDAIGSHVDPDDNDPCLPTYCDADGDGVLSNIDPDEGDPCNPNACDADLDGHDSNSDCDDSVAAVWDNCTDADGDNVYAVIDCNDGDPFAATDCSDNDGDGYRGDYDNNDDVLSVHGTWQYLSNPLGPINGHALVWTGTKLIAWGGPSTAGMIRTGAVWSSMSTVGAPLPGEPTLAVWTGSRALFWGRRWIGVNNLGGGLYNPTTDTWQSISMTNAPSARVYQEACWTGSKMVVYGGQSGGSWLNDAKSYDPANDTWTDLPANTATSAISDPKVACSASYMVVVSADSAVRLDLTSGVWTDVLPAGVYPLATGSGVVRGLAIGSRFAFQTTELVDTFGGIYDPVANTWVAIPKTGAPTGRLGAATVWTGTEILVWGGNVGGFSMRNGGSFNPTNGTWRQMQVSGGPIGVTERAFAWDGTSLIVLGGDYQDYQNDPQQTADGGKFTP